MAPRETQMYKKKKRIWDSEVNRRRNISEKVHNYRKQQRNDHLRRRGGGNNRREPSEEFQLQSSERVGRGCRDR